MKSKTKSKTAAKTFSIRKLATEFSIDRATVTKLCTDVGSEVEARLAIQAWQETQPEDLDRDPETGLTWWKAKLREDVLKGRAARDRDEQLAGGQLLPISVLREAASMAIAKFRHLAHSLYLLGVPIDAATEQYQTVERLGQEFAEDFLIYCRDWLDREAELQLEREHNQAAGRAVQAPADTKAEVRDQTKRMLVADHLEMTRKFLSHLESIPGRLAGLGFTMEQVQAVRIEIESARTAAASADLGVEVKP